MAKFSVRSTDESNASLKDLMSQPATSPERHKKVTQLRVEKRRLVENKQEEQRLLKEALW
jgi:hypothetical protein